MFKMQMKIYENIWEIMFENADESAKWSIIMMSVAQ